MKMVEGDGFKASGLPQAMPTPVDAQGWLAADQSGHQALASDRTSRTQRCPE
jgi:hypothetical protein